MSDGMFEELNRRSAPEGPINVSRHFLGRRGSLPALGMLPVQAYQSVRTHPDQPIKDRSEVRHPRVRIESAAHAPGDWHPHRFELDRTTTVKVAGFNGFVPNTEDAKHLYSTGTSQPNTLVVTDCMTGCIALACAAENLDAYSGNTLPGAKVRVFHLMPFSHEELNPSEVLKTVDNYLDTAQREGLTLRVAMHGGSMASIDTALALRHLLQARGIPVEFDETCERRTTDTPLGAVIRDDHSVQFVTQIVAHES